MNTRTEHYHPGSVPLFRDKNQLNSVQSIWSYKYYLFLFVREESLLPRSDKWTEGTVSRTRRPETKGRGRLPSHIPVHGVPGNTEKTPVYRPLSHCIWTQPIPVTRFGNGNPEKRK